MNSYLEQAFVFFSASVVLVPIFQRLGFGSVLGYLIAGVLVGPAGLGLIHADERLGHLSELGIIFLLFLIGLEIQPRKLWSMRHQLVGLGLVQIVLCTVVFSGVGLLSGLSATAAVVIGFALSLSSTAFAVQTLVERGLFATEPGQSAFSILLAQDLVAIPALAIVPALVATQARESAPMWQTALIALAMIPILIGAGRFVLRPLFRMIASTRSRDMFTAVTLFVVIGVTVLMRAAGLSVELGTFIAGVLLADSEYRHELETNLEPFRALLMGLFFVGVGMNVKLELLVHQPIFTLSFALGYLLLKSTLIYAAGRMFRLGHHSAKAMALAIAQGGEFAFVLFGIVAEDGVVAASTLEMMTAVITLSMALNPVLVRLDETMVRRWGRRAARPEFDEISGETPRVIIGGFGRFGQVFGRIFRAQGVPFVAIDHDPTQIELLRKFGSKVYYGDVSRLDLLESAGAAKAEFLLLAVDDVETSLKTAELCQTHFPHLTVYARARNRGHVYDLMELGIKHIKRETFDSSLAFTRDMLVDLGYDPTEAKRLVQRFREHDEQMLRESFKIRTDDRSLVSLAKQGAAQLADVLAQESSYTRISYPSKEDVVED